MHAHGIMSCARHSKNWSQIFYSPCCFVSKDLFVLLEKLRNKKFPGKWDAQRP